MKRVAAILVLWGCGGDHAAPPSAPIAVDVPPMPASAASTRIQDPPPDPEPVVSRAPPEPAETEPEPFPRRKPTSPGTQPFDKGAAAGALGGAPIQRCSVPGGPTGMGHATITWDPSGSVSSVSVDGGPFPGTATGGCLARVYSTLTVPPFAGAPVRVGKTFLLK